MVSLEVHSAPDLQFKNLVEEYEFFLAMVDLLDLDEIPFPCQNRVKQKMQGF